MADETQVHRVEVLIVDTDDVGPDGVRRLLEHTRYPNRAISPQVMSVETREVEWSDEHPLNHTATTESAYRELFGLDVAAELLAAREALRAGDALASWCLRPAGDGEMCCAACGATSPGGTRHIRRVTADGQSVECPLIAYRAARGAR